jgi:hypothetical protein
MGPEPLFEGFIHSCNSALNDAAELADGFVSDRFSEAGRCDCRKLRVKQTTIRAPIVEPHTLLVNVHSAIDPVSVTHD